MHVNQRGRPSWLRRATADRATTRGRARVIMRPRNRSTRAATSPGPRAQGRRFCKVGGMVTIAVTQSRHEGHSRVVNEGYTTNGMDSFYRRIFVLNGRIFACHVCSVSRIRVVIIQASR